MKLETATQWDRWNIELESNLKMVIGMNGILLSYVILDHDETDVSDQPSWQENARLSAPHEGVNYV